MWRSSSEPWLGTSYIANIYATVWLQEHQRTTAKKTRDEAFVSSTPKLWNTPRTDVSSPKILLALTFLLSVCLFSNSYCSADFPSCVLHSVSSLSISNYIKKLHYLSVSSWIMMNILSAGNSQRLVKGGWRSSSWLHNKPWSLMSSKDCSLCVWHASQLLWRLT